MADDLERIEARIAEAVAGPWAGQVETFRKAVLALWSANGQKITAEQLIALSRKLDTRPRRVDAAMALAPAAAFGDARVKGKSEVVLDPEAEAALVGSQGKPKGAVAEMTKRARALDLSTMTGVIGALGPLGRSVGEMTGAASWATHRAANEATASAARELDRPLVFIAERDACLECNSHAGDTGEALEANMPPLHPNCRCEVNEFEDEDVPKALKREALRSVLRGFSLPSESQAARLRAAQAALRGRPNAPESVKRYAATAIKRGGFPRGRKFPGSR